MSSSSNKKAMNGKSILAPVLLACAGVAYPFLVYAAMGRVSTGALVLLALALVGARFAMLRNLAVARTLAVPVSAVFVGTAALGLVDGAMATLAYPVLMNFGFAAAFGWSLLRPPSLVQVLASVTEPDPSPAAQAYMRKVSAVWCLFLVVNALVTLALALWGEVVFWALYTGFVSYVLMGLLFAGEWLVRRRVRRAHGEGA
ncbi:hypothetical protein [Magnetospirillum sulfuroxidans]|uniref:Intracellular septation protein A n=1 Tax=Magnetospirillum sulfuroxidans TaxID=611300 RepID=A0ABS5I8X5_9PROT|nr:hypothetical protein [Magnetospirillum sulfuroxidans]MBR9970178.1 hypothetical protein [Magnetospirillum sulfuroxidans]